MSKKSKSVIGMTREQIIEFLSSDIVIQQIIDNSEITMSANYVRDVLRVEAMRNENIHKRLEFLICKWFYKKSLLLSKSPMYTVDKPRKRKNKIVLQYGK